MARGLLIPRRSLRIRWLIVRSLGWVLLLLLLLVILRLVLCVGWLLLLLLLLRRLVAVDGGRVFCRLRVLLLVMVAVRAPVSWARIRRRAKFLRIVVSGLWTMVKSI